MLIVVVDVVPFRTVFPDARPHCDVLSARQSFIAHRNTKNFTGRFIKQFVLLQIAVRIL